MYKVKLIFKYLFKRRIAWVSLIAVTLCTAMVLVVIGVMGGWVNIFLDVTHRMAGDVVVYVPSLSGFGHYQEMLDDIRKLPEVKGAVPVIRTGGLINVDGKIQREVQVVAYGDLSDVGKVNSFEQGLYRQQITAIKAVEDDPKLSQDQKDKQIAAIRAKPPSFDKPFDADTYKDLLPDAKVDVSQWPGMIVGTSMLIHRDKDGNDNRESQNLPSRWVQLTVMDLGSGSAVSKSEAVPRKYWIADDTKTGLYVVDSETVYVPFDILQRDLGMDAQPFTIDKDGEEFSGVNPARCNELQVSINDGNNINAVNAARDKIEAVVQRVENEYGMGDWVTVETWDEHQAEYIGAVVHEKVLVTILFGIISIVAVFLVFCIFFMIVVEKTRDIGIIKSVGATNAGVAQIFLGYGLVIGLVGAGLGLLCGYLVIHNINWLHEQVGRLMGVRIFSPETYQFDTIPSTLDPHDSTWIVVIAILSALLGAIIPAYRAARMHPVESLRYE